MTAKSAYKNILITGASSGIGREFSVQVAASAENIYICGRDQSELTHTEKLISHKNPKTLTHILKFDLTLENERENLLRQIENANLDLVIFNAGGGNFDTFPTSTWEQDKKTIELNISSTVHLSRFILSGILENSRRKNTRGGVIFVSSHASYMRIPHFSVYASAKSFINHFALTLVQELSSQPLDILVVCPGATKTKFSSRAGLPQKMLSEPMNPARVANMSLRNLGKRNFLIIAPFDRILWLASRILPTCLFDKIVATIQKRMLKGQPKEILQ